CPFRTRRGGASRWPWRSRRPRPCWASCVPRCCATTRPSSSRAPTAPRAPPGARARATCATPRDSRRWPHWNRRAAAKPPSSGATTSCRPARCRRRACASMWRARPPTPCRPSMHGARACSSCARWSP
ncbi:MAG: hypothetical protein EOO54_28590, partial [Haliea sp.]